MQTAKIASASARHSTLCSVGPAGPARSPARPSCSSRADPTPAELAARAVDDAWLTTTYAVYHWDGEELTLVSDELFQHEVSVAPDGSGEAVIRSIYADSPNSLWLIVEPDVEAGIQELWRWSEGEWSLVGELLEAEVDVLDDAKLALVGGELIVDYGWLTDQDFPTVDRAARRFDDGSWVSISDWPELASLVDDGYGRGWALTENTPRTLLRHEGKGRWSRGGRPSSTTWSGGR